MRNWSVCVCVQYGIKKRVPIEPSQDPALEGRLGRKKKTPEELAAEAELAEQQALRSSTYNNALVTVVVCSACPGVGVHYEIRECGSFAPTLWAEVFRLDEAASS